LDFHSANLLKQQSVGRQGTLLLTYYSDSKPTSHCSYFLMMHAKQRRRNTNFIVFGLAWSGLKLTIYHTWGEHAYTWEVVVLSQSRGLVQNV